MKYLHSGYILFCTQAEFTEDGKINAFGLSDLFTQVSLPIKMHCSWVIGFGTPYERRQYKGVAILEDPQGQEIFKEEFNANDPNDIYKGHYILHSNLELETQGLYCAKVTLLNWQDENVWDIERKFWAMIQTDTPPDP